MPGKIYNPTPEQLARWTEEMKDWRNAKLVNADYYDAIFEKLAAMENEKGKATIGDMLKLMRDEGNEAYVLAFQQYLDTTKIEKPFPEGNAGHEIEHCFLRVGHTPEQEQFLITATVGMLPYTKPSFVKKDLDHRLEEGVKLDSDRYKEGIAHRLPVPEPRDIAVYYAAGKYLDAKIASFMRHPADKHDYQTHRANALAYPDSDGALYSTVNFDDDYISALPYQVAQLSKQEWRAIVEVATGLKEPKDTLYPKRMESIQRSLVGAGLLYDMKPWAERAVKNHATNHPKGEAFDPERFKAARMKRGAETRERE